MSRLGGVRRAAAVTGGVVGVAAAGLVAGALAERTLVARRRATADVPFGSLHGRQRRVVADDGVELYAEVDEPGSTVDAGPTVILVHGYALNLDCWHFQRAALRSSYRLVLFDQRSHGRSGRSPSEHCTIDQLGRDLGTVVRRLGGTGPVVLVGHSMGGMAIMALAEQRLDWFGDRVAGIGLVSTSAGDLATATLGLPGMVGRLLHRASPALMAGLARAPRLVERGRRAGSDFGYALTRRLSFGSRVPQEYVDFVDEMLAATPIDVVADFYPGFDTHDKSAALPAIASVPTMIVAGERDVIIPIDHARRLAAALPSADFVPVPGAGHMVLLERHEVLDDALLRLVAKAATR